MQITPADFDTFTRVLQRVSEDPSLIDDDERCKGLIAKIHRQGKKGERARGRAAARVEDRATAATTLLVRKQEGQLPRAVGLLSCRADDIPTTLRRPAHCYICKSPYTQVHFFYHLLCPACADRNYRKRTQRADLTGRVALVTGGRVKIGYETALRMLRDGARVLVTTRFPNDAARRFAAEADVSEWRDRLSLHGLDLRHLPSVEAFASRLCGTEPHLDVLINNAAQTIKRPLEFYRHLLEAETRGSEEPASLPAVTHRASDSAALLELGKGYPGHLDFPAYSFPAGMLDADGQQIDLRPANSWSARLDEVGTVEAVEAHLVNALAPFVLNSRLKPLLMRSPFPRRFIVNVSAMEGQFGRHGKTEFHPHTNMAKASLNMMTRTAARDYARDGVYMNSVDTGWITDENPAPKRERLRREDGFYAPLDCIDGMARIYDPVARGVTETPEPVYGCFLKDYEPHPW